jgi:hypothetical protein
VTAEASYLSYNSATDRHQVVPVLCCLLSPAYFLGASGSFFSAALTAGFGCSVFDFGSLKNNLIFSSTVNFYLLYSCIRASPLIPKQKYTGNTKYSDAGAFAHPLNSSNLIYIASELTSGCLT